VSHGAGPVQRVRPRLRAADKTAEGGARGHGGATLGPQANEKRRVRMSRDQDP
jgi:hypothetical protein